SAPPHACRGLPFTHALSPADTPAQSMGTHCPSPLAVSQGAKLCLSGKTRKMSQRNSFMLLALLSIAPLAVSCGDGSVEAQKRITPEYDKKTGRLTLLKYDSNGNGIVDTWSYMDGAHVVRIEIDKDEDGKIDRWEYYGTDQKLVKFGF